MAEHEIIATEKLTVESTLIINEDGEVEDEEYEVVGEPTWGDYAIYTCTCGEKFDTLDEALEHYQNLN